MEVLHREPMLHEQLMLRFCSITRTARHRMSASTKRGSYFSFRFRQSYFLEKISVAKIFFGVGSVSRSPSPSGPLSGSFREDVGGRSCVKSAVFVFFLTGDANRMNALGGTRGALLCSHTWRSLKWERSLKAGFLPRKEGEAEKSLPGRARVQLKTRNSRHGGPCNLRPAPLLPSRGFLVDLHCKLKGDFFSS